MSDSTHDVIRGGIAGRERLRMMSRVMHPTRHPSSIVWACVRDSPASTWGVAVATQHWSWRTGLALAVALGVERHDKLEPAEPKPPSSIQAMSGLSDSTFASRLPTTGSMWSMRDSCSLI